MADNRQTDVYAEQNKKNGIAFAIIAVVLIAVIVGSVLLYKKLSDLHAPDSVASNGNYATAADFTVSNTGGRDVKLSSYFGKPIVVNVWATWCGPCTNELPHFQKLYNETGSDVIFMFVSIDDYFSTAKNYFSNNGYNMPLYHDSSASLRNTYSVTSIPVTLFINSKGELVRRQVGAMTESMLRGYLEEINGK